jgi:hypothetical protein
MTVAHSSPVWYIALRKEAQPPLSSSDDEELEDELLLEAPGFEDDDDDGMCNAGWATAGKCTGRASDEDAAASPPGVGYCCAHSVGFVRTGLNLNPEFRKRRPR